MKSLVTLWLALGALGAQAPSSEIEVRAELTPDSARIGEVLTLIVTVSSVPGDAELFLPELPDTGAIAGLGPPQWLEDSREGVRSARYALTAWDVGELRVPASALKLVTSTTELTIPLPDIAVHIGSVLPSEADADTLAFRPPADVAGGNWSLQEKLAGAALVLALAVGLVLVARRRGADSPVPIPAGPPPGERALAAFARLERSGLLEAGELKAFYSTLSQIVREFLAEIDERWRLDFTTPELMAAVGTDGVEPSRVRVLGELLVVADLVKFARHRPAEADVRASLTSARDWVAGFERVLPVERVESRDAVAGKAAVVGDSEDATSLDGLFVIGEGEFESYGDRLPDEPTAVDAEDSRPSEDEEAGAR